MGRLRRASIAQWLRWRLIVTFIYMCAEEDVPLVFSNIEEGSRKFVFTLPLAIYRVIYLPVAVASSLGAWPRFCAGLKFAITHPSFTL